MRLPSIIIIVLTTTTVITVIITLFISNKYINLTDVEQPPQLLPQIPNKQENQTLKTTFKNELSGIHFDRSTTTERIKLNIIESESSKGEDVAEVKLADSSVSAESIIAKQVSNTTDQSERLGNTASEPTANAPLNILLLYADDWRHDTLGAAEGSSVIQTPFLDSLAKQGVRFRYNCVTTSICWISRVTLITGQFYSRHKQRLISSPVFFFDYWNDTYPGLLRNNGYHLGHVGKWHLWTTQPKKYDFWRAYYGSHWIKSSKHEGGKVHVTKKNEEDAIDFLKERPKGKPFCLTVAFFATHAEDHDPGEPWKPQPASAYLYVNDTVPMAPSATQEAWEAMPTFFDESNEARHRWRGRYDTPDRYQHVMKNYYRMATEVDSASKAIVEELERQGVLNNTLVIFTTDNGFFHAEHGLSDKFYPHQESIRVPLIIRDPRMSKDKIGITNDGFILSIDLASTIVSAAGLTTPERMQGRDVSVLYRNEIIEELQSNPWREEFYYELPPLMNVYISPNEALVQKDFKLINWTEHTQEQLFDLKNDPWELEDVINHPQHQELLIQMRKRLGDLREAAK